MGLVGLKVTWEALFLVIIIAETKKMFKINDNIPHIYVLLSIITGRSSSKS